MTDDYPADFCRQKWHQIGQISGREQLENRRQDDKTSGAAVAMDHLRGYFKKKGHKGLNRFTKPKS